MFHQFMVSAVVIVAICSVEIAYSRVLPYDPRYTLRRIPVRRSVGTVERIRLPMTRYFPQVDTQIASAPYLTAAAIAPAAYRLPSDDVYALPPKWSEDTMQTVPLSAMERNDDEDYAAYEYDGDLNPVYADEIYPQLQEADREELDGNLYNDLMVNYLLREMQPRLKDIDTAELLDIQRRNQKTEDSIPSIDNVVEANKRQNPSAEDSFSSSTSASSVLEASSPVSTSPAPQVSSSSPMNVLPTLGEASAAQTSSKMSMVNRGVPDEDQWNDFTSEERGQKEFPLFRPAKSEIPKSAWETLEGQLSRAKNNNYKSSFPLIEKLMAIHHARDPLAEQLDDLKFKNM